MCVLHSTEFGMRHLAGSHIFKVICGFRVRGQRSGLGLRFNSYGEDQAKGLGERIMSINVLIKIEVKICVCLCMRACVKWVVVFPHYTVRIGEWEHTGSKVCWELKP